MGTVKSETHDLIQKLSTLNLEQGDSVRLDFRVYPHPVSDLVGLRWGPRICISSTFPGDANAARLGTIL